MKKKFLLLMACALMGAMSAMAVEAYVEVTNGNTLTFYYGERPQTGTTYALNAGTQTPEWAADMTNRNISKVVFDPSFDAYAPTSTYMWFYGMDQLTEITGWEYLHTNAVTNMRNMFQACTSISSLNLSHFNTANVTAMNNMFYGCSALTTIYGSDNWNTENVVSSNSMFYGCYSLKGGKGTTYDSEHTGVTYARFDGGPESETPGYFTIIAEPTVIYATAIDGGSYTMFFTNTNERPMVGETWQGHTIQNVWSGNQLLNMGWNKPEWYSVSSSSMIARDCNKVVFEPSFAAVTPKSLYCWFANMEALTSIEGIENLNTSEVTNMNSLFYYCKSLTEIDVNSFDVSKVTNASAMFHSCDNLTTIYSDKAWNIPTADQMFRGCTKLVGAVAYNAENLGPEMANPITGYFTTNILPTVIYTRKNVNGLNYLTMYFTVTDNPPVEEGTWNGETVNEVWRGPHLLNMGTNTPGWYNAEYSIMTARYCRKVVIDPSFASVTPTSFNHWFANMRVLNTIEGIENLNTSEATDVTSMFYRCESLKELDVNSFDVSNVDDASHMFAGCSNLETIYCNNAWDLTNANSQDMFYGDTKLEGAVLYDATLTNGAMANPSTGYFTGDPVPTVIYTRKNVNGYNYLTMYFTNTTKRPVEEGTWEGETINHVWSGEQLLDMGWNKPGWYDDIFSSMIARYCRKVVIDPSFAELKPTSFYCWFANMRDLNTIEGLEYLNTSEATNMNSMFYRCESLKDIDINSFDISKVTNTSSMFASCFDLEAIYCDKAWDLTNATSQNMFYGCNNLIGAVLFDATRIDGAMANPDNGYFTGKAVPTAIYCRQNVNGMNYLTMFFTNTTKRSYANGTWQGQTINHVWSGEQLLDMGTNTPDWYNVEFSIMTARYCRKVVIDSTFAELKPKSFNHWFANMQDLNTIEGIENLNTSEATDLTSMFYNCQSLKSIDVNNFDVSKVTNASAMFANCNALETIYCNNAWDLTEANTQYMFTGDTKLVGAVAFDSTKTDGAMANPTTGYFTGESTTIPGDVNNDGSVNVMDVTAVINHILGNTPDVFNMQAADVNNDGNINVLDVTQIINIILNV